MKSFPSFHSRWQASQSNVNFNRQTHTQTPDNIPLFSYSNKMKPFKMHMQLISKFIILFIYSFQHTFQQKNKKKTQLFFQWNEQKMSKEMWFWWEKNRICRYPLHICHKYFSPKTGKPPTTTKNQHKSNKNWSLCIIIV